MDHSHMNHENMDHVDMEDSCNMSMLFTWDATNLCIVFRQWHIRSTFSLIISLLAVVILGIGYEALRAASRRYELAESQRVDSLPPGESVTESTPFLYSGQNQTKATERSHIIKGAFYALQNFYAFMLMLVFMTYNGWVMIAVTFGAFFGYLLFGRSTSSTKLNACH